MCPTGEGCGTPLRISATRRMSYTLAKERIVLADDHPVFRDGLRRLIQRAAPDAMIAEASSYDELLTIARGGIPPTTIVVDLFYAGTSIEQYLPALRAEFARSSIIVVSMLEDPQEAKRIMSHGADGFISKSVPPGQIQAAITAVMNGEIVMQVRPRAAPAAESGHNDPGLTQRQLDVLRLLAKGRSNKEIACALAISPFTVRIHVSALLRSLGVSTRAAAAARATADGLIS